MAVKPGEACYIPIGHRVGADDLFGGGALVEGQIAEPEALALLKPLLEAPGVLKLGHDIKFDAVAFAQRGIALAPFDDTLLISYALDGGLTGDDHSLDALGERTLGHKTLALSEVAGSGRNFVGFARVPIDRACEYAAENADMILRLWRVLKPRLAAEAVTSVYERLERPLVQPLARMERRGITIDRDMLSRLSGEFAQGMGRLEDEVAKLVGAPFNLGSPKQLGDILFGQMGLPGGKKTATGAWSTTASVLEDLAAEGHAVAGARARMAAIVETQVDLHRRAAGLRQSGDRTRAYVLRARGHHHGAPVVVRAQPAEHPRPHRGGPQDPPRLRRAEGPQAHLGRLQPDRVAPARSHRRHSGFEAGLRRQARHSRHDRFRNVRRADCRHAGRDPPAREGDQFRHHLRHLGLRPRQPAQHRARGGGRLHQEIFRALPRHPRLHGRDQEDRARQRLSSPRCSAANATIRASTPRTLPSARSTSAPPSTRRSRARRPTSSVAQ